MTGATWARQRPLSAPDMQTHTHTRSVFINHCSITVGARRLARRPVESGLLRSFSLWDSCPCATSRSVTLRIMQMHVCCSCDDIKARKSVGTRGCGKAPREMEQWDSEQTLWEECQRNVANDSLTLSMLLISKGLERNQRTSFLETGFLSQSLHHFLCRIVE